MRRQNHKWNSWSRRITVLLLLCGLLLPILPQTNAASVIFEYNWIKSTADLPGDDGRWHDYFIAWEDTDDKNKVWFTNYHWYTADGDDNIDTGGPHWMKYKAATTLPNSTSSRFTSEESLGHMQIKYAGLDPKNNYAPMYYIRVAKMNGGYMYFTKYDPTRQEDNADAFTFEDKGDVFHIFVSIDGKADRYLTRNGQYLETTESSSYGGGDYYRPLRVYRETYTIDESENITGDIIGKVTLYEYNWVNTVEEMVALGQGDGWMDVLIAWEDADGEGTSKPDTVWYTKEVWYEGETPNYKNGSFWEGTANEFFYWSNDILGSDGYSSAYADSFLLPTKVGHFQVKAVGWDKDNPISTGKEDDNQKSPVFNIRFGIDHGKYIYIGNNGFHEDAKDVEDYTIQLRLGKVRAEDPYGSVHIFNNMGGWDDEYITRKGNRFDISNDNLSDYWEYPFRIYTCRAVEYDAIVKSFTIGQGATYSVDSQLIVNEDVTITVEDGGILTIDDSLLNNGNIIVKNGGTLVVNEGGYLMAYDPKGVGKVTLDGGNLIIMEDAKVICDQNGGVLQVDNGAAIVNRGLLLVGQTLALNRNSYLKNETNGLLLVGGKIARERGGIGAFSFSEVASRIKNEPFTYLCAGGSKIVNKGMVSEPKNTQITTTGVTMINKDGGYTAIR